MTERALRVLSVNAAAVGGGAEKVTVSLHEAYLERDVDSWLALGNNNWEGPYSAQIPSDARRGPWARAVLAPAWRVYARSARTGDAAWALSRSMRFVAEPRRYARVLRGFEDFDFPETPYIPQLPPARPDVLHLHNLHGSYFDVRELPRLSSMQPTVVTLHDNWLLAGHCAYSLDCEHWRTACGNCPYLGIYVPIPYDQSAANCRVKREALAASRLHIATPSRWLLDMAEQAGVIGTNIEARVIPNGVDIAVFRPGDRQAARKSLGLPLDRHIVMFAGFGITESPYKGFDTLEQALSIVAAGKEADGVLLLAVGSDAPPKTIGRSELRHVPYVTDPDRLALYYRASDLYVHPARAENHPLAVIEAMACGTAVVASDVGGIPELVEHGRTGLLFTAGSAGDLAASLVDLLSDEAHRTALAAAAVRLAQERFTLDRQVDAYLDWYRELCAGDASDPQVAT